MQTNSIKTISDLSQLNGRVYVYLPTGDLATQFMQQAEAEGFTFGDGERPTDRFAPEVIAVNPNHTINYVGIIGSIAYGSRAMWIGEKQIIRSRYVKTGCFCVEHGR